MELEGKELGVKILRVLQDVDYLQPHVRGSSADPAVSGPCHSSSHNSMLPGQEHSLQSLGHQIILGLLRMGGSMMPASRGRSVETPWRGSSTPPPAGSAASWLRIPHWRMTATNYRQRRGRCRVYLQVTAREPPWHGYDQGTNSRSSLSGARPGSATARTSRRSRVRPVAGRPPRRRRSRCVWTTRSAPWLDADVVL